MTASARKCGRRRAVARGRQVRKSTVGQAMTEFALVLPVLALIFLGVLDVGRAYHTHIALANAARVGVIYAQQVETPQVQAACSAGLTTCGHIHASDVITKTVGEAQGGISITPASVSVCTSSYQTTQNHCPISPADLGTSLDTIEPNALITVTVTITTFKTITPLVHLTTISGAMSGQIFPY
jgi:Flp pilus assembly protein TadG